MLKAKPIQNITPFSMLDFHDLCSCIIWFAGCNMRCPYCYNPEIVFGKGKYNFDEVLQFLQKRVNLLDGVVLSGGECTLHKELIPFVKEIKKLGFKIKIDTNGTYPSKIKELVENKLVDFISLDFKADENKFFESKRYSKFSETYTYLIANNLPFEVRTTYHQELFTINEIKKMISFLEESGYKKPFYIQNFYNDSKTIGNLLNSVKLKTEQLGPTTIPIVIRN
jgi:pyruvate formate lyase activating enzyme